jgi:hypothetical protein
MTPRKIQPWEEACGILKGLQELDDYLQLDFGNFQVLLGLNENSLIRERLENSLGRRISILKTNLPEKGILVLDL